MVTARWEGENMVTELKDIGVTYAIVLEWSGHLNQIIKKSTELQSIEKKEKDDDEKERIMSSSAIRSMEGSWGITYFSTISNTEECVG